jgi:hypothetical protein
LQYLTLLVLASIANFMFWVLEHFLPKKKQTRRRERW